MPRPPARSRRPGAKASGGARADAGRPPEADPRVAALLAGDPAAFTRERDALARALADAGDAEGAARVRKLRRPTAATALLDRLAREAPDEVARLLDASARLGRGGDAAALREANAALRASIDALLREATRLASEGGRAPAASLLVRVERGLRAAAAGPEPLRRALAAGVLEKEPAGEEVDLLGGLAAMAPPEPARGKGGDREGDRDRDHDRDRDDEHARDRARHDDRARREGEQERERAGARRRADEEVRRAVAEVEQAERALAEARRRLADARRARSRL